MGTEREREREGTPGEVEVNNAFAVAGSLAQDLVPDSADQVNVLYSHILHGSESYHHLGLCSWL